MGKNLVVTIEPVDNGYIMRVEEKGILPMKSTYVFQSLDEAIQMLRDLLER